MADPQPSPRLPDDELQRLIDAFLASRGAGRAVPASEWLAARPELAAWTPRARAHLEAILAYVGPGEAASPSPASEPLPDVPGFELIEELGSGASGVVYKARDRQLDRIVALKLYRPGVLGGAAPTRRFLEEARAAAQVSHPNVVTIHSVGEAQRRPFLCMEYVEGRTLARLLEEPGPLPIDRALSITRDLARALQAIHSAGLLHRDVKPSNVMLDRTGRARLMDFGLASSERRLERLAGADAPPVSVVGTPRYMAPEQIAGGTTDARSDLFALGIVLYELLAGAPPFPATTAEEAGRAVLETDPVPLLARRMDVPAAVVDLVERLLAKDPARRPATAAEVEALLARALVDDPAVPQQRGSGASAVVKRWRPVLAAAVVLVAVGGAITAIALQSRSPPPPSWSVNLVLAPDDPNTEPTQVVRDGDVVPIGTKVQLSWQANRPLHVYAWNDEPAGSWALFPSANSPWTNPLPADRRIRLPSSLLTWPMNPPAGENFVTVIVSEERLVDVEEALQTLGQPRLRPDAAGIVASHDRLNRRMEDLRLRGASEIVPVVKAGTGTIHATRYATENAIWRLRFQLEEPTSIEESR